VTALDAHPALPVIASGQAGAEPSSRSPEQRDVRRAGARPCIFIWDAVGLSVLHTIQGVHTR
jgi:hypothetical protein